jgi:hypothetical protein
MKEYFLFVPAYYCFSWSKGLQITREVSEEVLDNAIYRSSHASLVWYSALA